MRGRCKRREPRGAFDGAADACAGLPPPLAPPPGETAAGLAQPDTPVPALTVQEVGGRRKGTRCSIYDSEKVYLGVRVKMPVRDLLRNIRLAKGSEPQDSLEVCSKKAKGDKKRVKTCRTTKRKHLTKSLEELSIIVEVLEEDLRTCSSFHSPAQTFFSSTPPVSPRWSLSGAEYNSDESDEMIPSPEYYVSYSSGTADCHQAPCSPSFLHTSLQPSSFADIGRGSERGEDCFDPNNYNWNLGSSSFFWTQLQKEEDQLRDICDAVLLATDEHGKTALHKVACVGKRALGYAIAKRMTALNSLDLKDADGMTALLYAAKHNHHLMVADLIHLGAKVNETNNLGKSCLHLSAEKGYFRVLEVVKHSMMDGVYVDVEATDNSGMSVLQCASLALKAIVRELENSESSVHTPLHSLHQEQMMETLECVLQMGSYMHTMRSQGIQPRTR